jgi:Sulfatase
MNALILFLSIALLLAALVVTWLLSHLPYPVWFYLPAIVRRVTNPTLPNQKVDWLVNSHNTNPKIQTQDNSFQRPNVLLIIADDLGVNDLSGGAGIATPHIDSIKENGIDFAKGYSGHATCAPSRAAIMTGRYATRFGFEFTPAPKQLAMVFRKSEHSVSYKCCHCMYFILHI